MIPTPIILGNWFAKKTGLAVSIAMSCSGIAAAIMNPIAAALIAGVGWRTSYLIAAAIAAVIVLPCTLFLIRFKPEDKGLLPYGIDEASESGAEEATSIMAEGVPARRAFRSPSFWLLALVLAMIAILSSFSQLLPVYMETIGMVAMVGLIASMAMIGQFVGTLGLGAVSDRFGGTATGLVGFAIAGVGFLLLIFFGQMVFGDLAGGVLYGAALALGSVAPPLLCRNAYGNRDFAKLYSSLMLVINGMAFVGMPLLSLTLDLTGSFYPALWLGFVLCVVAIPTLMASMGIAKRLPREGGAEEEVQKEGGALEETVVA